MAGYRAASAVLVADGQSLNLTPTPYVDTWPIRLCSDLGVVRPVDVWVGGMGWTHLLPTQQQRVRPFSDAGLTTVYTLCGGTGDLLAGRTAAQIYADMVTTAINARGWGYDSVIATTITPYTGFTGPQETVRLAANVLIADDADTAFDYKVNLAGTAGINNASDTNYYSDGLHFTSLGAQTAADAIAPSVEAALA